MSNSAPNGKSGNSGLAFIVGILVAAVAVLGYVVYENGQSTDEVSITLDAGPLEDAAESIEGAVESN